MPVFEVQLIDCVNPVPAGSRTVFGDNEKNFISQRVHHLLQTAATMDKERVDTPGRRPGHNIATTGLDTLW